MLERMSIKDSNAPIPVRYVAERVPKVVRLYTFTEEDDPNIKEGHSPFLLTCARAAYPELRLLLARQLGSFAARINQGTCSYMSQWNDLRYNPTNVTFQMILRGEAGPNTELFIIPLKRDTRGQWGPEGGIKFMSDAYKGMYSLTQGTLNLFMGWNSVKHDSLCVDVYTGGNTDNDSLCVDVYTGGNTDNDSSTVVNSI